MIECSDGPNNAAHRRQGIAAHAFSLRRRRPVTDIPQAFRVRERDYTTSRNPPILHRKETFVASDHPLQAKFARLTRQEEAKGLYEAPIHIGTRRGWEELLSSKGLSLRGHRLIRRQAPH